LYRDLHPFPTRRSSDLGLGEGRVDFRAILETVQAAGFKGPYILEIEGRRGEDFNRAQHLERLRKSCDYLRKIGLMAPLGSVGERSEEHTSELQSLTNIV